MVVMARLFVSTCLGRCSLSDGGLHQSSRLEHRFGRINLVIFILLFRDKLHFPTRNPFISSLSSFCASLEPNPSLAGPLALSRGNELENINIVHYRLGPIGKFQRCRVHP